MILGQNTQGQNIQVKKKILKIILLFKHFRKILKYVVSNIGC